MSGSRRGWPFEPVGGSPAPPAQPTSIEGPAEPVALEVLPAISRRAAVLLAVAGAVALVVASLGLGDWWVRNTEMRTLLDRVERAERAQLPAIQSISPLLSRCRRAAVGDTPEMCDTVAIRQGAERVLPRLRQTGDEVAGTRLTSFHGSLRAFRDRYVDHNLAWRSWLESLAQDPTAGGFQSPDSIGSSFQKASDAADSALTPFPLHGNRDRVDTVFASVR